MSLSPVPRESGAGSPELFLPDIRCNLDSQFQDARESTKCESMCVYARVRPLLLQESAKGHKECLAAVDEQTVRVVVPTTSAKYKSSRQNVEEDIIEEYTFTGAVGPEAGQFVFFHDTMLKSLENFVEGSNSLVFSYGITGSGKTYTLQGDSENPGIIPLSLKLYFAAAEKQLMKNIKVKPYMCSDIYALSEAEQLDELNRRKHILSLYDEECDKASGSFRNNNTKTFAMSLCNMFSDEYEAEQRTTTLEAEDMASAQAAAVMKNTIQSCVSNLNGICSVWVSFIEIYNESIYDLLQPVTSNRARLNLGEDKKGSVYVKGAQEICIFNSDEALKILNIGRKHLSIASTKMNYQSSRSHCIYTIRAVRLPNADDTSRGKVHRLSFCDLAGSERTSKAQTTGVRLKEASAINTSLLVLGRCLEQLRLNQSGRDKRMIPFRESKLTRIFSGFFTGQGKAVMIANASPSDYTFDETLHVLKFSALAKKIMVNDTFLSMASTTIHSICNQWQTHKSNTSMYNDSVDSIESSDSDVIQQKDELIEKLLSLAQNFAKKEKEMNDMEWRIRREVGAEWSEYCDQLLEANRANHREEMEALKQINERSTARLTEMYEGIIQRHKDQLDSETEESSFMDKTGDISKLTEELNDSVRSPATKSGLDAPKHEEKLQNDLQLKMLKFTTMTKELADLKEELSEKQNKISSLENELSVTKAEYEKTLEQSKAYKEQVSKFSEEKLAIQELENHLFSARKELATFKELAETAEFTRNELETEKEQAKDNVQALQNEIKKLKDVINSNKSHIDNLKKELNLQKEAENTLQEREAAFDKQLKKDAESLTDQVKMLETEIMRFKEIETSHKEMILKHKCDISDLEKELSSSKQESEKTEKIIQDQSETISSLENKISELRKNLLEAQKAAKEYTDLQNSYNSEFEKTQAEISTLQQELKLRESVSEQTEKEISELKKDLLEAQKAAKEHTHVQSSHNNDFEQQKAKILSLQQELKMRESVSKQTEKEIDDLKIQNAKLEKDLESILSVKLKLEEELKCTKEDLHKMTTKTQELEEGKESQQNVKKDIEELQIKIVKCEKQNECLLAEKLNLEKELDSAKKQINSLESNLKEISAVSEDLDTMKKAYEAQIGKLNQEKESLESSKKLLEESLALTREKMKSMTEDFQKNSSELNKLFEELKKQKADCELEVDNLKAKLQNSFQEKSESEKLSKKVEDDLQTLKIEMQKRCSELQNFKNSNNECKTEIDKLLKNNQGLITEKLTLEGRAVLLNKELENLKVDSQKKASQITQLEHEIAKYKQDLITVKENLHMSEKAKEDLKVTLSDKEKKIKSLGQLSVVNEELQSLKDDVVKRNSMIKDFQNKISSYEQDHLKLNNDLLLTKKEKEDMQKIILNHEKRIKELEEELSVVNNHLKSAKSDIAEKTSTMEDLHNQISICKQDLQKTKDNLQIIEKEKEDLQSVISANKKNIEELQEKLSTINNELKSVKSDIVKKNSTIKDFEKEASVINELLKEKETELKEGLKKQEKKHEELKQKTKSIENEKKTTEKELLEGKIIIEDLEKALIEARGELAELQKSFFTKITAEKEQHIIEIQETMKLKQEVEKENKALNEEIFKLKESSTSVEQKNNPEDSNKKAPPKASATKKNEQSENDNEKSVKAEAKKPAPLSKKTSTRSLRQKQQKVMDISLGSVDSDAEVAETTKHSRKRTSDEDFCPVVERASKRMKSAQPKESKVVERKQLKAAEPKQSKVVEKKESKIPVKRAVKRLQGDQAENLSPVQKIASTITSKFRAMTENVSSKMASPRLTRGRKKLFNPETETAIATKPVKGGKGKK